MITTVSSERKPATIRKVAIAQYGVAGVIAVASLVIFFAAGQQPEMSPEEYLQAQPRLQRRQVAVAAAAALRAAGADPGVLGRHAALQPQPARPRPVRLHRRHRADRAGVSAFFLLRAAGNTQLVGVGAAATLLGCAMLVVAAGSLLPSVEDWFGARRELRTIQPLLDRTRPTPSRRRHRGTPARPAGVPGRRADVADLRRAVPGGHRRRRRA